MNKHKINTVLRSKYLIILPLLVVSFCLAFIPHHGYAYPVHVDEWGHLTYSKALMTEGSVSYTEPYLGETVVDSHPEVGFHLHWGVFQAVTGISWLTIFKYFPGLVFLLTILAVYILAQRQGYGWEAAFFTCLIPTSVRLLGPGFLTPVALGMLFIPLSLFIAVNLRGTSSYLLLFIFGCFLFYMHPPTALGVIVILLLYIVFNIRKDFRHSVKIAGALAMSFVISLPQLFPVIGGQVEAIGEAHYLPYLPQLFHIYGYIPTVFFVAGVFLLSRKGGIDSYTLIFASLAFLVLIGSFAIFNIGLAIMYDRGYMYLMLLMSIIAGYALSNVNNIKIPIRLVKGFKTGWGRIPLGRVLCLVFISLLLITTIQSHLDMPYYHIINQQQYNDFVWIRENIDDRYDKAILDPWTAIAFTSIAGKTVYSRMPPGPSAFFAERNQEIYRFFSEGYTDTDFLKESNISIVYTEGKVDNPDLVEVKENIYLVK